MTECAVCGCAICWRALACSWQHWHFCAAKSGYNTEEQRFDGDWHGSKKLVSFQLRLVRPKILSDELDAMCFEARTRAGTKQALAWSPPKAKLRGAYGRAFHVHVTRRPAGRLSLRELQSNAGRDRAPEIDLKRDLPCLSQSSTRSTIWRGPRIASYELFGLVDVEMMHLTRPWMQRTETAVRHTLPPPYSCSGQKSFGGAT